jgi:hypothetical protein
MCSDWFADIEPRRGMISISSGHLGRVADQFELVANLVQDAAALRPRDFFFTGEADRHRDGDRAVLADAQEIDMERTVGHRMELHVLGQGPRGLTADVDHHDRVHEVAVAHHLDEALLSTWIDCGGWLAP